VNIGLETSVFYRKLQFPKGWGWVDAQGEGKRGRGVSTRVNQKKVYTVTVIVQKPWCWAEVMKDGWWCDSKNTQTLLKK